MNYLNKIIFLILFLISFNIFSQDFVNYTFKYDTQKIQTSFLKVLVIGVVHNYNSNIIEYYKYSNLNDQLGGVKVLYYSTWYSLLNFDINSSSNVETILSSSIRIVSNLNPDYILLYNMDLNKYEPLEELLERRYKNKYYTIGYDSNIYDINLTINIDKFLKFLKEINREECEFYFVTNPRIKVFKNFIKSDVIDETVYITKVSELRAFLRNLKSKDNGSNIIIINNLNYLFSDVDGQLLLKDDILNEFYTYSVLYPVIDISFENQYRDPIYFEFEWNFFEIFTLMDSLIISDYYGIGEEDLKSQDVSSKLNVTLENIYKIGMINNYDLLSIQNYIKHFDDIK